MLAPASKRQQSRALGYARPLAVPVTLCFLFRGDRLLLQRRAEASDRFAGLWNAVGGHVEPGEDVRRAALREIREETGLEPASLELRAVIHETGLLGRTHLLFVFRGEVAEHVDESGADLTWFDLHALPEDELVADLPALVARVREPVGPVVFGTQRFDGGDRSLGLRLG